MPLFDNCRIIVPSGKFHNMEKSYRQRGIITDDMVELDVRKAFTKAFIDIERVPALASSTNGSLIKEKLLKTEPCIWLRQIRLAFSLREPTVLFMDDFLGT